MLSIIAAIDLNNGIGKENKLLAHIDSDLNYFKKLTLNHTIVMGYNTYMSLPKKPLQNRNNIVITNKLIDIEDISIMNSIEDFMNWYEYHKDEEVFIIGGESIYRQLIKQCDRLYITHIMEEFESDSFFPHINKKQWQLKKIIANSYNLKHKHKHLFALYEKI